MLLYRCSSSQMASTKPAGKASRPTRAACDWTADAQSLGICGVPRQMATHHDADSGSPQSARIHSRGGSGECRRAEPAPVECWAWSWDDHFEMSGCCGCWMCRSDFAQPPLSCRQCSWSWWQLAQTRLTAPQPSVRQHSHWGWIESGIIQTLHQNGWLMGRKTCQYRLARLTSDIESLTCISGHFSTGLWCSRIPRLRGSVHKQYLRGLRLNKTIV